MEGYIKIYRSFKDWEWYGNANTTRLFLHILLTVNYKDVMVGDLLVKRGQGLYTTKGLAEELGMSEKMVRTSLEHLKRAENLAITRRSKNSLITVLNYEWYQGERAIKTAIKGQSQQEKEIEKRKKKRKEAKENKERKIDKEIRTIEEGEEARTRKTRTGAHAEEQVKALFNSACSPLPRLTFLTRSRREAIGQLLQIYSLEDIRQGFQKVKASSFLQGKNDRKWRATFDWLVEEDHFARLLEGAYDDGEETGSFDTDEFFEAALKRSSQLFGG